MYYLRSSLYSRKQEHIQFEPVILLGTAAGMNIFVFVIIYSTAIKSSQESIKVLTTLHNIFADHPAFPVGLGFAIELELLHVATIHYFEKARKSYFQQCVFR